MSLSFRSPEEMINLDRYPIADMNSPEAKALIQRCREQFDDAVSCHLEDFLKPEVVQTLAREVSELQDLAHRYSVERGAYNLHDPKAGLEYQDNMDATDPRLITHRRHQRWLGTDDLAPTALSVLYNWPNLTEFVAAVLDQSPLYTIDDPLMRVLVNINGTGDELGWHVDSHDFAVTLLLKGADAGGLYQYVPMTGPGDTLYEEVPALFNGDQTHVRTVPMEAGSLVLFRGRNTLHRVTPVESDDLRLLALFAYEPVPNRVFGDAFKQSVLGRTTVRT